MANESMPNTPGIVTTRAMHSGLYAQSFCVKGRGYSLIGLVSTYEEKVALTKSSYDPDDVHDQFPFMKAYLGTGADYTVTLHVDMVNRRAEQFVVSNILGRSEDGGAISAAPRVSGIQEPEETWVDLPQQVWFAFAVNCSSAREIDMFPSTHWDV
jgi:hypothetical protein